MTKAEREAIRVGYVRGDSYPSDDTTVGSLLTALDEKDALIADLLPYAARYLRDKHAEGSTDAKLCFAELSALKARAEK